MYNAQNLDPSFSGLNWFTWFVGVVVDIDDPLKLGRMKVRCFGFHSLDPTVMPKDHLPWAEPILPVNQRQSSLDVNHGDWVVGFFMDGRYAQKPVIYGVFNGLKNGNGTDELTPQQLEKLPQYAQNIILSEESKPTGPRLAYTVVGSTISLNNKRREHVCDVSLPMRRAAEWVRLKFSEFMKIIREGIRAALKALGFSPDGTSARLKEIAQAVTREAKQIQKFLKQVNSAIEIFNAYVAQVNQMIEWILSLPEKLLALLVGCLENLRRSLAIGFSELFSTQGSSSDLSAFTEAAKEIQNTLGAAVQTASNAAAAAANAAATAQTVSSVTSRTFKI
jgi:methyl-accepting chemotaxis protein